MKKAIENYIPAAIKAVAQLKVGNFIPSEYNGYIASLGASIIQMGLLPTIAVFSDRDSGSSKDKSKLLRVIHDVIKSRDQAKLYQEKTLFEIALALHKDNSKMRQLRNDITHAAIAIKLCMRTYEMKKEGGNHE